MGQLPDTFQFNQGSLQDYLDCPRRFQLRYILEQPWPAVESEPLLEHEQYAGRGRRFHQLLEQHTAGLPVETLTASLADADLARWWRNYLNTPPPGVLSLPLRRAEVVLSAPIAGHRLVARYDLLAMEPGQRAVIVDWKTERKRPTRAQLAERMQTRVYRYLLVEAAQAWNAAPLPPEQVEMIYWFAEFPAEPEIFAYDAAQHAADSQYISDLIAQIAMRTDAIFPLTPQARHCRFCVYRSLCDRGSAADSTLPGEQEREPDPLAFEWSDIEEIAY